MTPTAVFACRDARGPHWQLGPLPPAEGRLTLIGWSQSVEPRDGGVPEDVARVLAHALTTCARVTFPCSSANPAATSEWSPLDDDLIRALSGTGMGARLVAKLRGLPPEAAWMSTRRPETAMRLFDDAGFPWWLQGQVVLLSKPDAPPPDIDAEALVALSAEDWTTRAASLAPVGIAGIVRPGVDGDVAGLLSRTDAFEQQILAAVESETRRAGFEWAELSEEAFELRVSRL